jgi:hypothetical protein
MVLTFQDWKSLYMETSEWSLEWPRNLWKDQLRQDVM